MNWRSCPCHFRRQLARPCSAGHLSRPSHCRVTDLQAIPPIHIIVKNGHVTLEGVVSSEMEKNLAAIRASSAGLSFGPVQNNLQG